MKAGLLYETVLPLSKPVYGVQVYFCLVRARVPGPGGPVLVARSRWPGPVARSRWPGPGGPGGPVPVARSRWPGPGGPVPVARFRVLAPFLPWPGGPVPVPVPARAGAPVPVPVPAPVSVSVGSRSRSRSRSRSLPLPGPGGRVPVPIKKADHLCSVASFKQSLPGIWWFYAVLQTTGERQTILRSRNHYRTKTGAKRLPKPTA